LIKQHQGLFDLCRQNSLSLPEHYFGGEDHMDQLLALVRSWKISSAFYQIYNSDQIQKKIFSAASRLLEMMIWKKNAYPITWDISDHKMLKSWLKESKKPKMWPGFFNGKSLATWKKSGILCQIITMNRSLSRLKDI
jgi:hypothetical protein